MQFVGGLDQCTLAVMYSVETAPKRAGGYALLDLGIKINPNSNTEVMGMLRINNEYGGFWGGGVTFDVRQLYVVLRMIFLDTKSEILIISLHHTRFTITTKTWLLHQLVL